MFLATCKALHVTIYGEQVEGVIARKILFFPFKISFSKDGI
jgi:hypothetical protein